jgi:hypothetical protein
MPIFIVDNIAVELGLANGSGGTLVNLDFEKREGRRYAISAEVDITLYTSSDPNAIFPHRITIPLAANPFSSPKAQGKSFTPHVAINFFSFLDSASPPITHKVDH